MMIGIYVGGKWRTMVMVNDDDDDDSKRFSKRMKMRKCMMG
jgi:hypothetical protein